MIKFVQMKIRSTLYPTLKVDNKLCICETINWHIPSISHVFMPHVPNIIHYIEYYVCLLTRKIYKKKRKCTQRKKIKE